MPAESISFAYALPTEIHFGYGTSDRLGDWIDRFGARAFFVVDPAVADGEMFAAFRARIGRRLAGSFADVTPNPTLTSVRDAASALVDAGGDCVVGIGGGSTIDTAKAACLAAATSTPVEDYHRGRAAVGLTALPLIAVPTTAGTGSEVTNVAALTLDAFLRYNAGAIGEKLSALATRLGSAGVDALADRIAELKGRLALPTTLAEAGVSDDQIDTLVAESFHPNMKNNPRPVTADALKTIYLDMKG